MYVNMLKFTTLLLLAFASLLTVQAALVPTRSLQPQDGRIVGGAATTIAHLPWQVSIQTDGSHFCGGSIYNEYTIVTAAHCLKRETASTLKVRAGSTFWNSGGVLVQVAAYIMHEDYNPYTMEYDVAIIRLATPLTFKSTIKPIPLTEKSPADGEDAIASGWGTKGSGAATLPTLLQSVTLKTLTLATCGSDANGYGEKVYETMICTYTKGKDACQGDSGGPLVSAGKLVGIVSWGYGCADDKTPGVYSDVAALREWIVKTADLF